MTLSVFPSAQKNRIKSPETVNGEFIAQMSQVFESALPELLSHNLLSTEKNLIPNLQSLDNIFINIEPNLAEAIRAALIENVEAGQVSQATQKGFLRLGEPNQYKNGLQEPSDFYRFGIIPDTSTFVAGLEMVPYFRAGGELYLAIDLVLFEDKNGKIERKFIVKKAIVAGCFGTDLTKTTTERVERLEALGELGIPIAHIYGVESATIFEDLYTDKRKEVLDIIMRQELGYEFYLDQLIEIGKKLDNAGYPTLGFISDMVYDQNGNTFRYVDSGFDLGNPSTDKNMTRALETLIAQFPDLSEEIIRKYQSTQNNPDTITARISESAKVAFV